MTTLKTAQLKERARRERNNSAADASSTTNKHVKSD